MKILVRTLILALLCPLGTPLLKAQSVVGTLTCTGSSLSATIFETEIFVVREPDGNFPYGSTYVILDAASYPTLFSAHQAQTVFPSCSMVNGSASVVMTNVVVDDVEVAGYGNGVYGATSPLLFSFVSLTYSTLTTGGVSVIFDRTIPGTSAAKTMAARARAFTESFASRMASK